MVAAVALGGAAIALQALTNAELGRDLGALVPAAADWFGVGILVLMAVSLMQGQGGAGEGWAGAVASLTLSEFHRIEPRFCGQTETSL